MADDVNSDALPGWKARGDRIPEEQRFPFNRPTLRQIIDALPFVSRYFFYWLRRWRKKESLFINTFQPLQHKPHYGVPCGTIGSGSIGRDFRGGFCKFGLRPGLIEHKVDIAKADQFIVTVRQRKLDNTLYQRVLCAAPIRRGCHSSLKAWDFNFPAKDLTYRGLYPRSWTTYSIPECRLTLVCRQISPVIPHDYEASSLPTTVFVWEIKNDSENDYDVSITFTFRNGTGDPRWKRESVCQTAVFDNAATAGPDGAFVQGVCLEHKIARMKCTYAIGAVKRPNQAVTICRNFRPCGSGRKLWDSLFAKGQLEGEYDVDGDGRELGVAVCVSAPVPSGKRETMELALAWDMPKVAFGQGGRVYKRRYTRWYGDDCKAGPELCRRALIDYRDWERRIDIWQTPVLNDERLPAWYKSALFNELYFMTDGGSIWFEFDEDWTKLEKQLSPYSIELMRRYGRFGYLESWEYRMVNTYDVHFYASFALAQLWPQLEHALQSEFTDQVEHLDEKSVRYHMEGDWAPTKSRTRVPHDLGNPADDPWLMTNAYVMHDTGKWKDLNLKFILTCYRDYVHILNRDETFLRAVWPAVEDLIREALDHWDHDKDGMIENSGAADQTYDAWKMTGVSAYCGSLWLAALQVARRMAEQLGEVEKAAFYAETLGRARAVYEKKLWNKTYYKFDEHSRSRDTIMADQLCGYWFLDSVCVEDAQQILPLDRVKQALNTIYDYNVCKFAGGRMGAVNGMKPNGTVDRACIQADEVWTGVTYAVAAFLIQQGELEKGFRTASGCYEACFERFGLQYQTPEALYEHRFYRAIGYMRPLSIWAMQWALEKHCGFPSISDILLHEKRIVPDGSDEDVLTDATADLAADTTTTTAAAAEVLSMSLSSNSVSIAMNGRLSPLTLSPTVSTQSSRNIANEVD